MGLVVSGRNREVQGRAFLVPHAAVVAGDHAKAILARRKIGVERLPAIAGVLPVAIHAFQLVAKEILLRSDETERCIVDLQIAHQRWQTHASRLQRRRVVDLAVGSDLLDVDRRREFVEGKMARIDDLYAFSRHEPQFAIGRLSYPRAVGASRRRTKPDTVRCIPNCRLNSMLRVGDPGVHFGSADAHEATGRVQPERTIVVFY